MRVNQHVKELFLVESYFFTLRFQLSTFNFSLSLTVQSSEAKKYYRPLIMGGFSSVL